MKRLFWKAAGILPFVAMIACGDGTATPTGLPSDPPLSATHGSSSQDLTGQTCIVSGGAIFSFVDGHSTLGYISADDKSVKLVLNYTFVPGTDNGNCPQPFKGDWSLQSNGAGCNYSGPEGQNYTFVDCTNPGKSQAQSSLVYPDKERENIRLDLNVS
jgi:prepilin-type processing-associated H-X9-DG protein